MTHCRNPQPRHAFTLIELMVVIGLIGVLATLVVLVVDSTSDQRAASRGADQLQGWLAGAKYRSMRDQLPRGIRLIPSQNDPNGVFELKYVEQPENFVPYNATLVIRSNQRNVAYVQGDITSSVHQWDMLEIAATSERAHRISAIRYDANQNQTIVTLMSNVQSAFGSDLILQNGYHFIRQPVEMLGEPPLELPKTVMIDLSRSLNLPRSYSGQIEIVYSPSGQVIGATGGRIVLWVRDVNNAGEPTLMTIYSRTGHIAAHPPGPAGNEYLFTQDGLSSGL